MPDGLNLDPFLQPAGFHAGHPESTSGDRPPRPAPDAIEPGPLSHGLFTSRGSVLLCFLSVCGVDGDLDGEFDGKFDSDPASGRSAPAGVIRQWPEPADRAAFCSSSRLEGRARVRSWNGRLTRRVAHEIGRSCTAAPRATTRGDNERRRQRAPGDGCTGASADNDARGKSSRGHRSAIRTVRVASVDFFVG
jgi:hypothetical protein